MTVVPRLVIAAPSSGSGKTTVATGLLAAFAQRGLRVSPHKVGPDYIDAGYHALAAGRPGRNLDPYLTPSQLIAPLFAHGANGSDIAIVEGVMGLFDGASGAGQLGSTAQVAASLRAPVILVVDASTQGRSIAALVHGFRSYEASVWFGGVILNRVSSPRHEQILRSALEEIGVPVFGALRRSDAVTTPSRHLGLVPVAERRPEALRAVRRFGEIVGAGVDLDRVLALARSAPGLSVDAWDPVAAVGGDQVVRYGGTKPVVAVAGGAAFGFSYAETVELLHAAGAEVAPLDPLRDEALPEGTKAVVIGGGFPELYAEELSANEPLRNALTGLASSGGSIAAESAGMLWLARSLDGKPMCGILDAEARTTDQLALGYRSAVALSDSVLAPEGTRVHGHVFHRTYLEPRAGTKAAWQWKGRPPEGFVQDNIHASFLQLHWAGTPGMAGHLVAVASGAGAAADKTVMLPAADGLTAEPVVSLQKTSDAPDSDAATEIIDVPASDSDSPAPSDSDTAPSDSDTAAAPVDTSGDTEVIEVDSSEKSGQESKSGTA